MRPYNHALALTPRFLFFQFFFVVVVVARSFPLVLPQAAQAQAVAVLRNSGHGENMSLYQDNSMRFYGTGIL